MIRVVLVDDHVVVRDGIESFLELSGQVLVVGTATTAEEALDVVAASPCDLVLLDLELPANDGIWCTRQLKERHDRLAVVILTMHADERLVMDALRSGADGYLLKSGSGDEVIHALQNVHRGGTYIDQRLFPRPLPPSEPAPDLTPRQREVLSLAARGMNNPRIADELVVSENTVKTHFKHVYAKIGVKDRVSAVLWAQKNGIR